MDYSFKLHPLTETKLKHFLFTPNYAVEGFEKLKLTAFVGVTP